MKACTEFDVQYLNLLQECFSQPFEKSMRTNKKYQSVGPVNLILKGIPIVTVWDIDIKCSINKMLTQIVKSKNNILSVIHALICDSTSKNCVLNIGRVQLENITPYIIGIHFSIIKSRLNMSVLESSTDVFIKLPHTVFEFCFLWCLLSARLGIKTGICSWNIGDAYVYTSQKENIERVLEMGYCRIGEVPNFNFKATIDDLGFAMQGKETLVHDIYQKLQPAYDRLKGPKL